MDQHHSRERFLLTLSRILSHYEWLLNSYNVDYFLNDHWKKIPPKWIECLNKLDVEDIPWLLDSSKQSKCLLPLTFLCLRSLSESVRLIRSKPCDPIKVSLFSNSKNLNEKHTFSKKLTTPLDHILTRGIKLKKRHEIEQLCKLISCLMQKFENQLDIIDFGSGKCHLSRILNLCYGYRLFCVEANKDNINGAVIREEKVMKALKKYKKFPVSNSEEMTTKVNCYLTKEKEVDQLFGDQITRPHLLLGLHACGALSNLILEEFVENSNSKCLVLACCCYMKSEFWFPMSRFLKKNSALILTIEAKELACHAIEKFLQKFSKKELDSLKVHGYRACLEYLIEKYAPHRRHQSMKSVKIVSKMTFKEYVEKAIKSFDDIHIPEDAFQSDLIRNFISQINSVIMFYSLRLLIAPIVELFILLDYQQYLWEQNTIQKTYLLPLFEPEISPRNFILIAYK